MSELLEIIENFDNINLIKKKEYKKNWIIQNKDKINGYARLHYLKKLKDLGDDYRTKLNEKNKESRKIKKELFLINNPDIVIKKKGRPKKEITNIILKKKLMEDQENSIQMVL